MGDLDIHFRRLLRAQVQDLLRMAFPAHPIEAIGSPIDPSVDRSRKLTADNLFRVRHAEVDSVVHIEIERDWRPTIPRRLFEYGTAAMTETQAPVVSLVVLLRPGGAPPDGVGTYRVPGFAGDIVVFRYHVLALWQLDARAMSATLGPTGFPYCLAMQGADEPLASRFAEEVRAAPGLTPDERRQTLELLSIVAAAIFGSEAANRIFHMESLLQDPNVQEFIRSWEARGEVRGEAREARTLLYRLLAARSLPVPPDVRERIDAEADVERLEAWHDAAATASSIDDVFRTR